MNRQRGPGPCPKCGSADTKFTTVKPPKVAKRSRPESKTENEAAVSGHPEVKKRKKKKKGNGENETAHRCTSACEQTVRLCVICHLVTPLPPGMEGGRIFAQRRPESQEMQRA